MSRQYNKVEKKRRRVARIRRQRDAINTAKATKSGKAAKKA
jgi:hypothetical protein